MTNRRQLHRASAEIERAVGAVRLILILVGSTLMVGVRTPESDLQSSVVRAGLIMCMGGVLALLPSLLRRVVPNQQLLNVVLQTADTIATLGLVHLLSTIAPDSAWVLITVPIVIASLRLGSVGVVLVWVGSTAGYLALFWLELHPGGRSALATSLTLERPGILLAVAACVAVLTRWLQEAWTDQAIAAQESELRLHYVATLEHAGRELQETSASNTLPQALSLALDFDFLALTALSSSGQNLSAGDTTLIPRGQTIQLNPGDPAELITWNGNDDSQIFSLSLFEPISESVVTAWSETDLSGIQIDAFANMLGLTSMHLKLAQMFETAQFEANHDPLTGLSNRAEMNRQLSRITSKDQHLALLFLDLDRFKHVNDSHGHQTGDDVLVFVADRLRRIVGPFGTIARFGGDEFVVALAGDRAKAASDLARHLHEAINGTAVFGDRQVDVSMSIGIGRGTGPLDPDRLLKAADEALFLAKDDGRGTTRELRVGVHDKPRSPSGNVAVTTVPLSSPAEISTDPPRSSARDRMLARP